MSDTFKDKTIVVGITGSIAAYKVLPIIQDLQHKGANVHCILTESAAQLISVHELEKIVSGEIHTSLFRADIPYTKYLKNNTPIEHISLSDQADLILVCPATANILAKVAHGIADDLLTSTILATQAPVIICPAMNVKMWKNAATQENVTKLNKLGYTIVDPEYGELACGYEGVGRLAHIDTIIEQVQTALTVSHQLKRKKVIVTAGGTHEPIDAVRIITNLASGKMGIALADCASRWGAEVVLIKAHTTVESGRFYKEIKALTPDAMRDALQKEMKDADIVFHTAAVSDFGVSSKIAGKVKSDSPLSLELTPTTKILEKLRRYNPKAFIVGFKAEVGVDETELIERAFKTLQETDSDMIVANEVGKADRGFGTDTNEVYIVDRNKKVTHIPLSTKKEIAQKILAHVIKKSR